MKDSETLNYPEIWHKIKIPYGMGLFYTQFQKQCFATQPPEAHT
jgi:hypothetical protein